MAVSYFDNLPDIYYSNTLCKDITRRAVVTLSNTALPSSFYPYDLNDFMRADHIAEYYYEEPQYDWLVHLANKIVDPYYGWYNDDETLNERIVELYGSVETAQQKVKHYINNWADDDTIITTSYYQNNLTPVLRKYWTIDFDPVGGIRGYKRVADDTIQNTNQIWQFEISANNEFQLDECVTTHATGTDTIIGRGEVDAANSSIIRLRNISGSMEANSSVTLDLRGVSSDSNVSTSNSYVWFYNISNTEFVYYSAVTFYDWEVEQNESRRTLNLVGDGHATIIEQEFERLMRLDTDPETGLSLG